MNIILFKKEIEKIEEHQILLKKFRVWSQNSYISYTKLLRCEKEEIVRDFRQVDFSPSEEELEAFEYQWQYICIYDVIRLYSEMEWEVDDYIKEQKLKQDSDVDCLFYNMNISYVYEKILNIEDDISFCYALCLLMESVSDSTNLYEKLVKVLYEGLDKFGLTIARKIIDQKREETVFVAMSFSTEMKDARETIEAAIIECGYKPILIDVKEHNNQIVPEIFREIENSKFIVADLTEQKSGVYYEAGYAQALNKNVILMCRNNEKEKVHFDVGQINTIFWKDLYILRERLVKRIVATIGKNINLFNMQ